MQKVSTTGYNCAKVCIYTVGRPYRWKGLCLHCYSGGHYYRCKGVRALMKLPEGRKASITSHAPYTFLTPSDNTWFLSNKQTTAATKQTNNRVSKIFQRIILFLPVAVQFLRFKLKIPANVSLFTLPVWNFIKVFSFSSLFAAATFSHFHSPLQLHNV